MRAVAKAGDFSDLCDLVQTNYKQFHEGPDSPFNHEDSHSLQFKWLHSNRFYSQTCRHVGGKLICTYTKYQDLGAVHQVHVPNVLHLSTFVIRIYLR